MKAVVPVPFATLRNQSNTSCESPPSPSHVQENPTRKGKKRTASQPAYIAVTKQYQTIAVQILRSICSHESVFQHLFPRSVTLAWMMPSNSYEKNTQEPATRVVQITGLVLTPPFGGYEKGHNAELDVAWRMPIDDAWVVAMSSNGNDSDRECGTLTIEIDFTISHSEVASSTLMMNVRSLVPKRLTFAASQNLASSPAAAAQELQLQFRTIGVPVFWSTHQASSSSTIRQLNLWKR